MNYVPKTDEETARKIAASPKIRIQALAPGSIVVTEQSARAVLRLLEDVRDVDERARCSDVFFRQHFLTMATLPAIADAAAEIKGALDATE